MTNFIKFKTKCARREKELLENIRLIRKNHVEIKEESEDCSMDIEPRIELKMLERFKVFSNFENSTSNSIELDSNHSKDEQFEPPTNDYQSSKEEQADDNQSSSSDEPEANDQSSSSGDIDDKNGIETSCPICNKKFRKSKLAKHKNSTHKNCPDCNKPFGSYSLMLGHRRRVHATTQKKTFKTKTCPICDVEFPLCHELFDHKRLIHKQCPECLQEFSSYNLMIQHRESVHLIKTEIEETKFACDLCGKEVRDVYRHIRAVHKKKRKLRDKDSNVTFPCPYETCDKTFKIKDNINRHVRSIHLKERNFRCDLCEMSFFEISQLKNHSIIHQADRPITCDFPDCNKTFKSETSMKSHKNIHLKPEDRVHVVGKGGIFICCVCGKVMHSKAGHAMHLLIHTNEKPHQCEICHKKFRHAMVLLAHKRIHTNEKPYHCDICKTNFRQHSHLITHKLTHENGKKFSCSICDMSTKFKYNLDTHMKTVHQVDNNYAKN